MQGRDLVVELLAALVEATRAVRQYLGQGGFVDSPCIRQFAGDFKQSQRASHITIGGLRDQLQRLCIDFELHVAKTTHRVGQRMLQRFDDLLDGQRLQYMHATAREQGRVEFKRRILGGGADQNDDATLDVRQERVLLGLVEAVHFVDKQHRASTLGKGGFGLGQCGAHIRQSRQHRRDRLEFGIGIARQQQGQGGLAASRRAPQDHRMQLAAFDGTPQRLAFAKQATLADNLIQRLRTHALRQRLQAVGFCKQGG